MEIEENAAGASENTPQAVISGENNQDESQNPNGSLEATIVALSGIGGGQLEQELNAVRAVESSDGNQQQQQQPTETPGEKKPDRENNEEIGSHLLKESISDAEKSNSVEVEGSESKDGNKKVEEEKIVIESPIFGGKKTVGTTNEKVEPIVYEGSDVANKLIKDKTGNENLESLINSSLNLQEKASGYDAALKESKGYVDLFKNMPAELYEAVNSYANGNDWKEGFSSRPNLDFAKKTEDHSNKSLVDNYMPGKFTEQEWEDYKGEDCDINLKRAMDMAVSTSSTSYENDRKGIESLRDDRARDYDSKQKAMSSSVDSSIEYLKKNIEGIDSNYVDKLQKDLSIDFLSEIFLNADGSFREDAALKVVMAKDGYKMIEQYKGIAERRIETKERQEVLLRTPDKIKAKKTGSENRNEITPELQNKLDMISGGFVKQTVY